MKSLVSIDCKNRNLFNQFELNIKIKKSLQKNKLILNFQKWNLSVNKKFTFPCSQVRLKNRCILTGRGSSISRIYRLSRIKFRELGREGLITGLNKSSW